MKNEKPTIEEVLTRGVAEIIDEKHLRDALESGKKLRVKFGADPTSPNIHLGRAVSLLKLRDLQNLGHHIIFLVGNFTGVIGDTSDKESERPMLDEKTVEENMKTYFDQAGKILDMSKVEVVKNADWLEKLTYKEISKQANAFSLAEFIARDNIKRRMEKGTRISLREVLYPLMQGYDSVVLKADLELGGTDQRFNLLAGRELQREYGQKPQDILTVNLIEGLDGRKMSSSWGNSINLTDDANSMFGKVMSMGDELIIKYFVHCTRVPMGEVLEMEKEMENDTLNPRDAKLRLAREIVEMYHGEDAARDAHTYFISTFSKKEIPDDVLEIPIASDGVKLTEFLIMAKLAASNADARRKIEQGGVSVDGEKLSDWKMILGKTFDGKVMKVGKFGFAKVVFKK